MSAIELVPLCRMTGDLGKMEMVADTPFGHRVISGVRNVRLEGERLTASQRGESAADWLLVTPDDVAHIDVRMTLRTDDGAFVYLTYQGRADWAHGHEDATAFCTFLFETAHEDYRWLNRIVAVGRGRPGERHADYEIFEMR